MASYDASVLLDARDQLGTHVGRQWVILATRLHAWVEVQSGIQWVPESCRGRRHRPKDDHLGGNYAIWSPWPTDLPAAIGRGLQELSQLLEGEEGPIFPTALHARVSSLDNIRPSGL